MKETGVTLFDNLLMKGEIPEIRVTIPPKTLIQIVLAVIVSAAMIMMLHQSFSRK